MRAAAIRAAAAIDPDGFLLTLSGMEPDPHWIVRAALADVLGSLPANVATDRAACAARRSGHARRSVGARGPGQAAGAGSRRRPAESAHQRGLRHPSRRRAGDRRAQAAGGAAALREAYRVGLADSTYDARAAALAALAAYGAAEATETLKAALADKDWALQDPRRPAAREARSRRRTSRRRSGRCRAPGVAPYDSPELVSPQYSPHAFIETAKGTIEIELTVLDAPQTAQSFIALARKGYFNGLQIPPRRAELRRAGRAIRAATGKAVRATRIRDELNDRPYLRGTVGMALSTGPTPAAVSSSSRTRRSRTSTRSTRSSATSSTGWTSSTGFSSST